MSFNLIETSIDLGKPIRLYKFARGVITWGYCTADRDITYQTVIYRSTAISDDGIRQTGETSADVVEITAPKDIELVKPYRIASPSSPIELTIYEMHYGDAEAIIKWMGSISSVKFPSLDRCKIICNSDAAGMNQTGLRLTWARGCGYTLYEPGCNVNRDLFKVEATVQSMNGVSITSGAFASKPDAWFDAGYVEWSVGSGQFDRRAIESHTGSTLILLGGTAGLVLGYSVTAYAGCSRAIQRCHDKFNNAANYGGAPHQPGVNPFGPDPIF